MKRFPLISWKFPLDSLIHFYFEQSKNKCFKENNNRPTAIVYFIARQTHINKIIAKAETIGVDNHQQEAIRLKGKISNKLSAVCSTTKRVLVKLSEIDITKQDMPSTQCEPQTNTPYSVVRTIWRSTSLTLHNKIRMFSTNMKSVSVLVYDFELGGGACNIHASKQ